VKFFLTGGYIWDTAASTVQAPLRDKYAFATDEQIINILAYRVSKQKNSAIA